MAPNATEPVRACRYVRVLRPVDDSVARAAADAQRLAEYDSLAHQANRYGMRRAEYLVRRLASLAPLGDVLDG